MESNLRITREGVEGVTLSSLSTFRCIHDSEDLSIFSKLGSCYRRGPMGTLTFFTEPLIGRYQSFPLKDKI